jgi:ABC-type glycerol-3-phosphate transport system permease component
MKIRVQQLATQLLLMVGALIVLVPFLWTVSSSFKPLEDIFQYPVRWIPERFTFDNYVNGWRSGNFTRYFINSTLVAGINTASIIFFSALTGFAITFYRFFYKKILFGVIIVTMVIPIQVRVIPLYLIIRDFGWIDSYLALIVPQLITPIGIFIMVQFLKTMPYDLVSAARIDGSSEFGIFSKIILPLCGPAISALAIISFMNSWNDYLWPLIAINSNNMKTVSLGLASFRDLYYTEYGQLFALSLLVILPILLLFLVLQKRFIESAALSGMKG